MEHNFNNKVIKKFLNIREAKYKQLLKSIKESKAYKFVMKIQKTYQVSSLNKINELTKI